MIFKDFIKNKRRNLVIAFGFYSDYKLYKKYNYMNTALYSKSAIESKILRQMHVLEKGMSLRNPRDRFGIDKAKELINYIEEYKNKGFFNENNDIIEKASNTLSSYLKFHKHKGNILYDIEELAIKKGIDIEGKSNKAGICTEKLEELLKKRDGDYASFVKSRHSIRQFSKQNVDVEDIKKSVELAKHSPSACNRQPCKVYFYENEKKNKEIGSVIVGNTGFEQEPSNYLIVTSNISAFHEGFERNQLYVDGGIFTLSLVQALHYYGIGSCILQNGERRKTDKKIKEVCPNIPKNEKVIAFIAIGYYEANVIYAVSARKNWSSILQIVR